MADLPLPVSRPDGPRFFDRKERTLLAERRRSTRFDAEPGAIGAWAATRRDVHLGDRAWADFDISARQLRATGERTMREHRRDRGASLSPVLVGDGQALEVQVNQLLHRAIRHAPCVTPPLPPRYPPQDRRPHPHPRRHAAAYARSAQLCSRRQAGTRRLFEKRACRSRVVYQRVRCHHRRTRRGTESDRARRGGTPRQRRHVVKPVARSRQRLSGRPFGARMGTIASPPSSCIRNPDNSQLLDI